MAGFPRGGSRYTDLGNTALCCEAFSSVPRGTRDYGGGTYAGGGRGILDQSTPLMPLWWQCPHPAAICEQIAAGLPQLAAARASRGRGRGHWKGGGIARAMGAIPPAREIAKHSRSKSFAISRKGALTRHSRCSRRCLRSGRGVAGESVRFPSPRSGRSQAADHCSAPLCDARFDLGEASLQKTPCRSRADHDERGAI